LLPGLTPNNIHITYFCADNVTVFPDPPNTNPADNCPNALSQPNPSFVDVRIEGFTHRLIVPVVEKTINGPAFATRLPIESYGNGQQAPNQCFTPPVTSP
jgi:hypothetical protein